MNRFSVLTGIPESTKGLVRELRVRWALEELGLPYEEVRYPHPETKQEPYLSKQPFGQVPYFSSGDLCMFESGAILLHLALKHNKLLPLEETKRAHALTVFFMALNTVEPYLSHNFLTKIDKDASEASKLRARILVEEKLKVLSGILGERRYFGEDFTVAELLMTTVLRVAKQAGILGQFPNLVAYVQRNEGRPGFKKALRDHEKLYG